MFLCPVSMVLGQEKSITGCLVDLIEQIAKTLDNGEFAVTLFLDPSKIFDTINHSILLSKLSLYGIVGLGNLCRVQILALA